jgi:hypothetical protein
MLFHLHATKSLAAAAWGEWSIHSFTFISFSYIFTGFFFSCIQGIPALLASNGSLVSHILAFIRTNQEKLGGSRLVVLVL